MPGPAWKEMQEINVLHGICNIHSRQPKQTPAKHRRKLQRCQTIQGESLTGKQTWPIKQFARMYTVEGSTWKSYIQTYIAR